MTVLKFYASHDSVECNSENNSYLWFDDGNTCCDAEETGLSYEQALWLAERFEEIDIGKAPEEKFWDNRKRDFSKSSEQHLNWLRTVWPNHKLREQPDNTPVKAAACRRLANMAPEEQNAWFGQAVEKNRFIEKIPTAKRHVKDKWLQVYACALENNSEVNLDALGVKYITLEFGMNTAKIKLWSTAPVYEHLPREWKHGKLVKTVTSGFFVTENLKDERESCIGYLGNNEWTYDVSEELEKTANLHLNILRSHEQSLAEYREAQKPRNTKTQQPKIHDSVAGLGVMSAMKGFKA